MEPTNRKMIIATSLVVLAFGVVGLVSLIASSSDNDTSTTTEEGIILNSDVIDIIAPSETLIQFLNAATTTGLAETLRSDNEFTVFAPVDNAFLSLPEGTLAELTRPENSATLRSVLEYHIVYGSYTLNDLSDGRMLETLQGSNLQVKRDGDTVSFTDSSGTTAQIISLGVEADNGYVYAIDAVLQP